MAILVPDDKLVCFGVLRKNFGSSQSGLAFYPGPVLPPRADGSPLDSVQNGTKEIQSYATNEIFLPFESALTPSN